MRWVGVLALALVLCAGPEANAGDLDGWGGQPWGSEVGGPKDPAGVAAAFPPGFGEAAYLVAMRSAHNLFPAQTFFGFPAANPSVFYVEGGLGAVVFTLGEARFDHLVAALTAQLGEPFVEAGTRHFQKDTVSVSVQPYAGTALVNVVSVPHRARCVAIHGMSCQIAQTKEERVAAKSPLTTNQQAEWNRVAEEHRQAQEKALAELQRSNEQALDMQKRALELMAIRDQRAVLAYNAQLTCSAPGKAAECTRATQALATFDAANQPPAAASEIEKTTYCVQTGRVPDCWRSKP